MRSKKNNCIKFAEGPSPECEEITFEGFNDPSTFNSKKFSQFIEEKYGYHGSPFVYPKNKITEISGKNSLRPQQKFVGSYVNFNTNFNGCLVYHKMGAGKCLAYDTPVIMHDGSVKKVQEIQPGDMVMGDDSSHRMVESLGRGEDDMFEIRSPSAPDVDSHTVNSEHILSLKAKSGESVFKNSSAKLSKNSKGEHVVSYLDPTTIQRVSKTFPNETLAVKEYRRVSQFDNIDTFDISVKDYLKIPETTRKHLRLYKPCSPIKFGNYLSETTIPDAKILGVLYSAREYNQETVSLETEDARSLMENYVKKNFDEEFYFKNTKKGVYKLSHPEVSSPPKADLPQISKNCIPENILTGSIQTREEFLDGWISNSQGKHNGSSHTLEYVSNIPKEDILFLTRSLGHRAHFNSSNLIILMNSEEDTRRKNLSKFEVLPKGRGKYYGFELTGNGRFLLGDFTVSHNTCTSIIVGEAYKAYYEKSLDDHVSDTFNRIIVSAPSQVEAQYRQSIKGWCSRNIKIKGEIQDYSNIREKTPTSWADMCDSDSDLGVNNQMNEEIVDERVDRFWNFISHQKFVNGLFSGPNGLPGRILSQLQKPGNLLIIDEIQNLVSEKGSSYSKLLKAIEYYMHPDNKLIIMSATPIYDKPFEAGLTLNLLRPRLRFPRTEKEFNKLFVEEEGGSLSPKNMDLFRWMCAGYVSYFSGGDPSQFPYKRKILVHHPLPESSPQTTKYFRSLAKECQNSMRTNSGEDLFSSQESQQTYFVMSQMRLNAILPKARTPSEKISKLRSSLRKFKGDTENLLNYVRENVSAKYASVVKTILNSKGTSFVFTNYILNGANILAEIFEALGYSGYNPLRSSRRLSSKKPRFALWTGGVKPKDRQIFSDRILSTFNANTNKNGEYLKIVIGTRAVMEGISFRNVRNVHILNPWWNESRIRQIEARAARFRSHVALDPPERYVNIYMHLSTLPDYPSKLSFTSLKSYLPENSNSEAYKPLWRFITQRKLHLNSVEKLMHDVASRKTEISRAFESSMKRASVDCVLNHYGNKDRLVERVKPYYQTGNPNTFMVYFENESNGKTYALRTDPVVINKDAILNIVRPSPQKTDAFFRINPTEIGFTNMGKDKLRDFKNYVVLENIKCGVKNINFQESVSKNKALWNLYRYSSHVSKTYKVTSSLNSSANLKTMRRQLLRCFLVYIKDLPKNKRNSVMREIKRMAYEESAVDEAIDIYVRHNGSELGVVLSKPKTLKMIISNPEQIPKVSKASGKPEEFVREVYRELDSYIYNTQFQ